MSRRAREAARGTGSECARTAVTDRPVIPRMVPPTPSDRAARLLAALSTRAATWGWLNVYLRVRAGEPVKAWHRGMMEFTRGRLARQLPSGEGRGDG